jgi:hypothetical protein
VEFEEFITLWAHLGADQTGAAEEPADTGDPVYAAFQKCGVDLAKGRHLSFYTVLDCHWLPLLRDLCSGLVVVAVLFCRNGSAAWGCINHRCPRPVLCASSF